MSASLLEKTFARFPQYAGRVTEIREIEKGGSDRHFYRLSLTDGQSLILAKYGTLREENRMYAALAIFMRGCGIRVPEIYAHEADAAVMWMEDLGNSDLWSFRDNPWPFRQRLYERALDQLVLMHSRIRVAHEAAGDAVPRLQPCFDAEYYRWEQSYFMENCLGRFFHVSPKEIAEVCPTEVLGELADHLASLPRVVVHRDFQSQNIVIKDDEACLIDFQGMRLGVPQYDLASILLDPYVRLPKNERDILQAYYLEKATAHGVPLTSDFEGIYQRCAIQRLMQALGAYGFLGLVRERLHFLQYIKPATTALRDSLEALGTMPALKALLDRLLLTTP